MTALDRPGEAFRRALDDVGRRPEPKPDDEGPPAPSPGPGVRFDFGPALGAGCEPRWSLATAWADEPSPRPPKALEPALDPAPNADADADADADVAEAVAGELGFGACLTKGALAERWRAFVWRNHPDRQPEHGRERANARVAVANALYDSARRTLGRA